ncbi:hypothetical protein [uncultured Draconibacterium sp.]|mgnify:CR=1 FL=1|uniref:hypothetical protein n=1 Tax=uncultured Draconibacterium sp. TaxID=1573823 RepID=UPI0025EA9F19|nr:hypothetical protein [uncultured Draconibacterium sp.]
MPVNYKSYIAKPAFPLFLVLLLSISFPSQKIFAQSVIYKTDGTTLKAYRLTKAGQTRSYKLSDDPDAPFLNIRRSEMDSVRYEDGSMERFFSNIMLPETETPRVKMRKNLIGINLWPVFYGDIEILYERRIGKHLGFKNNFLFRRSDSNAYGNYYETVDYTINSGLNYYFLESDLYRLGVGAAYNFGQYEYVVNEYTEVYDPYTDYYYTDYTPSSEKRTTGTVVLNGSVTAKIHDRLYITFELDVPLYNHPPADVIFKTEFAINF